MGAFLDNSEPVLTNLHASFDPMSIPPADKIMSSDWHDAEEFKKQIGGRHWEDVGEDLVGGEHQDDVFLLSDVGLGYYLGSYMYASLLVCNSGGYGYTGSTIAILRRDRTSPDRQRYFDERATRLRRHTGAIIAFLKFFQEDMAAGLAEEATFALESYWNQYR